MSAEIERKYTVKDQSYRQESIECKYYKQGYISIDTQKAGQEEYGKSQDQIPRIGQRIQSVPSV